MAPKVILLVAATAALARAQDALPTFEDVSIRHGREEHWPNTMQISPGDNIVAIAGRNSREIIAFAYNLSPVEVVGGPFWVVGSAYDIEAKAAGPEVIPESERRKMLQSLLADRFGLKFHREIRSVRARVLVVDKGGPKIRECHPCDDGTNSGIQVGRTSLVGRNTSMHELAEAIDPAYNQFFPEAGHHLVVDRTGLNGQFDFDLKWSGPAEFVPHLWLSDGSVSHWTPSPGSSNPSLPRAIEEQLGLKLKSANVQREVLVIDQLKKPTTN